MIKKVIFLERFNDKFHLPVDLLKMEPAFKFENNASNVEYIIGGFYKNDGYSMYAFYEADSKGNILNNIPLIHDEGLNTYVEIFQNLGYTYL